MSSNLQCRKLPEGASIRLKNHFCFHQKTESFQNSIIFREIFLLKMSRSAEKGALGLPNTFKKTKYFMNL